jgi:trehalose 6-phosphate synthase
MPLRSAIVTGLLGADVVAFQRPAAVNNFLSLVEELLGLPVADGAVDVGDRRVTVTAHPQSVDVSAIEQLAADDRVRQQAVEVRKRLGAPRRILLAVDRLHPAKGIEQRLVAYDRLLSDKLVDPATTVLIQVVGPDPLDTEPARQLRQRIERRIGHLNGTHGAIGRTAVHYLHRVLDAEDLVTLYLAADVMVATPLVDGMNLAAKDYLAARLDDSGALLLSEFSATAEELPEAFVVNPNDVDALAAALRRSLTADPDRLAASMAAMRSRVRARDVQAWAGELLAVLGRTATVPAPR